MTFEEFKALALNPPYIDRQCVYRVDMHRYTNRLKDAKDVTEFEVKLCQSIMYADWRRVRFMLPRFIHKEYLNEQLYALYIYELPINCDISCDQYQRLWVYDRTGNLNAQSVCAAMIKELDHTSARFRGRYAESIRFKPGDIVEVYDRDKKQVRLGVVVKQPPTIEQCWEMRKAVEKACIAESIGIENTDDNYWHYTLDDCYCVVYGPDSRISYPHTTDVLPLMYPVSDALRQHFAECYHLAINNRKQNY